MPTAMDIILKPLTSAHYPAVEALLLAEKLPVEGVVEHLENFIGLFGEEKLIGVVGLEIYGTAALLRSLAVTASEQGKGYGKQLYRTIIDKAREAGVGEIYLLTETAEGFFAARGFRKIPRAQADPAVQQSVEFRSACPASAVCMVLG